jgi:hypothetical protein
VTRSAAVIASGVLDHGQGAQKWAATQPLKAAGVGLFENKPVRIDPAQTALF